MKFCETQRFVPECIFSTINYYWLNSGWIIPVEVNIQSNFIWNWNTPFQEVLLLTGLFGTKPSLAKLLDKTIVVIVYGLFLTPRGDSSTFRHNYMRFFYFLGCFFYFDFTAFFLRINRNLFLPLFSEKFLNPWSQ